MVFYPAARLALTTRSFMQTAEFSNASFSTWRPWPSTQTREYADKRSRVVGNPTRHLGNRMRRGHLRQPTCFSFANSGRFGKRATMVLPGISSLLQALVRQEP